MNPSLNMSMPKGFTLTELAVVLVIISLLIGGLLMPLSSQDELRKVADTQKSLNEIRDALLGYATINKRLPCPMALTTTDPSSTAYGFEDATQCNAEGILPWKTVGVSERDAWGSPRSVSTDSFNGFWRYRADAAFNAAGTPISIILGTSSSLMVNNATTSLTDTNTVVALVYSIGPNQTQDGANATLDTTYQASERSSTFDDQMIWISRPVLVGRMIAAGVLP